MTKKEREVPKEPRGAKASKRPDPVFRGPSASFDAIARALIQIPKKELDDALKREARAKARRKK